MDSARRSSWFSPVRRRICSCRLSFDIRALLLLRRIWRSLRSSGVNFFTSCKCLWRSFFSSDRDAFAGGEKIGGWPAKSLLPALSSAVVVFVPERSLQNSPTLLKCQHSAPFDLSHVLSHDFKCSKILCKSEGSGSVHISCGQTISAFNFSGLASILCVSPLGAALASFEPEQHTKHRQSMSVCTHKPLAKVAHNHLLAS